MSPPTGASAPHPERELELGFATRAIHVGSEPNPHTGAVIPPISLSTTFKQDGIGNTKVSACGCVWVRGCVEVGGEVGEWERGRSRSAHTAIISSPLLQGYDYSRSGNPNRDSFERALASLEGGAHGLAFSSGSATTATILSALSPDSHIVSVNDVYGGTYRYFTKVANVAQHVKTSFVDLDGEGVEERVRSALRENTRVRMWMWMCTGHRIHELTLESSHRSLLRSPYFLFTLLRSAHLDRNTHEPDS